MNLKEQKRISYWKEYRLNSKLSKDANPLNKFTESKLNSAHIPTNKPELHAHRLKRAYPLELEKGSKKIISSSNISQQAKKVNLKNNEQRIAEFEGATLRITTKSLIVEGLTLWADPSNLVPSLVQSLEQQADGIMARFCQKFAINANLSKARTSMIEMGLTEQKKFIEECKQGKHGKMPYYWDGEHLSVWGDLNSPDTAGEVETDRMNHAKTIQEFYKPVFERRFSTEDQLKLNQSFMEEQHKFFERHNNLIEEIRLELRELREAQHAQSGYRIRKKGERSEDRQRRL